MIADEGNASVLQQLVPQQAIGPLSRRCHFIPSSHSRTSTAESRRLPCLLMLIKSYQCLMCLPQFYPQALPKNQFAPFSFLRTRIFNLYWLTWLTPVFDVVAVCFADQASISLPKSFWSNNGKRWWDLSRVLRLNWCYWLRRIGCVASCDFVWLRVTSWFCGFIHSVSQGFARFWFLVWLFLFVIAWNSSSWPTLRPSRTQAFKTMKIL